MIYIHALKRDPWVNSKEEYVYREHTQIGNKIMINRIHTGIYIIHLHTWYTYMHMCDLHSYMWTYIHGYQRRAESKESHVRACIYKILVHVSITRLCVEYTYMQHDYLTYLYTYKYVYVYIYIYHIHICVRIYVYICTYLYTWIHIYINMFVHIHIYVSM